MTSGDSGQSEARAEEKPLDVDSTLQSLANEHPADIADAIVAMSAADGAQVLAALPPQAAADALEHMSEEDAEQFVAALAPALAASAVQEMAPDDAADLLAELPDERRAQILAGLGVDDRAQLEELMAYPPESAGGIMSPEGNGAGREPDRRRSGQYAPPHRGRGRTALLHVRGGQREPARRRAVAA